MMRVTGKMLNLQLLENLQNNYVRLQRFQDQLASGQRVLRPGDDPIGVGYVMRYDTELSRSEEFLKNVSTALGWLKTMDSLMQQSMNVLHRARTLVQEAATGTVPADARLSIAAEFKQLKEQMVTIGNSTYDGRFMFNGQKTDVAPYTLVNAANDATDRGVYRLNVAPGVSVPLSIPGEDIFGQAGSAQNVFKVLDDVIAHLQANDQNALLQDIAKIEERMDAIQRSWAEIGARTNRFELIQNRILDEQISLQKLRSDVNDVDMAEVITQLKTQESVLQATLAVGARIAQVSLVDFLK